MRVMNSQKHEKQIKLLKYTWKILGINIELKTCVRSIVFWDVIPTGVNILENQVAVIFGVERRGEYFSSKYFHVRQTTWHCIPENVFLHSFRHEIPKFKKCV
jgi:hypothetical protein